MLARITPLRRVGGGARRRARAGERAGTVAAKQALFAELDRAARPDTVLASSSSGIPASAFTEELKGGRAAWSRIR